MKTIINKLKNVFKSIYVVIGNVCYNIKFLCTKNIEIELLKRIDKHTIRIHNMSAKISRIFDNIDIDNIDDRIYSLESSVSDVQNDIEDKVSEYQIQDIFHDEFGYSEDYVNYDDMNDIKGDIKEINNKLNDINNVVDDNIFIDNNERHALIDDVIETIINKLKNNENV